MDYTRYSRAVIVLEEQNREFAARLGDEIKGYLRVETGNGRGAFRCVMQNVKYFPRSEYTYQLILFGKHNERTIHTVLGTVPVSRYGTGEVYLRFRPQDVDGQGNDYGRYTTAIIAAVSSVNKKEQLHPVLMGKTGHEEERTQVTSMGTKAEASLEEERAEPTEKPAEEAERAEPSEKPAEETEAKEGRTTYNGFYGQYLQNVCAYLCSVPGYYRRVQPFAGAMGDVQWLKIDNPKSMFLVSPGAQYFAGKYGHFLLGYQEETGREAVTYYVAVPGRFRAEDQPDGGTSGFVYWLPLGEEGHKEEHYGYWIVAIDGATGDIFSPERG